jgi:hypothetical protein
MANVYQAKMSDGKAYDVTTDRSHQDHDDQSFKRHLLDIIKSSISQTISGVVVGYVHKGRK